MRRVAVAGFCVCVALFAGLPPLAANQGTGAGDGGGDPTVYVDVTDSSPGGPAGGSGRVSCDLFEVTGTLDGGVTVGAGAAAHSPVDGHVYWLVCRNLDSQEVSTRLITYSAASAPIAPADLAAHAYRELPLVFPMPLTAPRQGIDWIVKLRGFLWVDPAEWVPRSATASLPLWGLSATVTARPDHLEWEMGDGSVVRCDGPGVPYDYAARYADQDTYCGYSYERTSRAQSGERYPVTAWMVWKVSWSSTTGAGGVLPDVRRGTRLSLRVAEVQALVTCEGGGQVC
ncbi:MAG: hypothetical protein M3Q30_10425 [Actinomycetota bacterium]|nr:hypothetical protein [Actinomycetota bacterium]